MSCQGKKHMRPITTKWDIGGTGKVWMNVLQRQNSLKTMCREYVTVGDSTKTVPNSLQIHCKKFIPNVHDIGLYNNKTSNSCYSTSSYDRDSFFTFSKTKLLYTRIKSKIVISDKATHVSLRERGIFILYPLFRKNPGGKKILFLWAILKSVSLKGNHMGHICYIRLIWWWRVTFGKKRKTWLFSYQNDWWWRTFAFILLYSIDLLLQGAILFFDSEQSEDYYLLFHELHAGLIFLPDGIGMPEHGPTKIKPSLGAAFPAPQTCQTTLPNGLPVLSRRRTVLQ